MGLLIQLHLCNCTGEKSRKWAACTCKDAEIRVLPQHVALGSLPHPQSLKTHDSAAFFGSVWRPALPPPNKLTRGLMSQPPPGQAGSPALRQAVTWGRQAGRGCTSRSATAKGRYTTYGHRGSTAASAFKPLRPDQPRKPSGRCGSRDNTLDNTLDDRSGRLEKSGDARRSLPTPVSHRWLSRPWDLGSASGRAPLPGSLQPHDSRTPAAWYPAKRQRWPGDFTAQLRPTASGQPDAGCRCHRLSARDGARCPAPTCAPSAVQLQHASSEG